MKLTRVLLVLCLLLVAPSCFTLTHTVGGGPTGSEVVQARQWYVFWGLIRLGSRLDSENLAANATSYRVTSEWSGLDIVMNVFTGLVTVVSRTVTIER